MNAKVKKKTTAVFEKNYRDMGDLKQISGRVNEIWNVLDLLQASLRERSPPSSPKTFSSKGKNGLGRIPKSGGNRGHGYAGQKLLNYDLSTLT